MRTFILISLVLAIAIVGGVLVSRSYHHETAARARDLTGGDPARGRQLAGGLGCVACHITPNVVGPRSKVGPSLAGFAGRRYIAGTAENTPAHLIQFLRDPPSVAPKTAMPHLRLSEADARDLAAFLYTLQ
jgi:cytochrome c2